MSIAARISNLTPRFIHELLWFRPVDFLKPRAMYYGIRSGMMDNNPDRTKCHEYYLKACAIDPATAMQAFDFGYSLQAKR